MTTTYILNALPNSVMIPPRGYYLEIHGTSEKAFIEEIEIAKNVVSAVGHKSTADVLTKKLGIPIEENRIQVKPEKGDILLIAAFDAPRRLKEGELFTDEEISNMEIKYGYVEYELLD